MLLFSSRIIKGGALLEESLRLVEYWDDSCSAEENLKVFRTRNLLGKRSRARAEDTLAILRQRFVEPGPHIIPTLRALTLRAEGFRDACYYEAARNDELLAYTASHLLREFRDRGRAHVNVNETEDALLRSSTDEALNEWGESTRTRVVHGLLSALRDFGVLEGKANKRIAPPSISFTGFVYVLGRLREDVSSSFELVTSPVWSWWLLERSQVRGHLLEADREGIISYMDVGSTVRIDWRLDGLEDLVRAVA